MKDEREDIENNTRMYGGQYSADLTHQCTHLIIEISFFLYIN